MKARLQAMVDLAESEAEVAMMVPDDFNADTMKLAVANGVLNLRNGELLPFNRQDFITQQVNISYDPEADCPVWKAALQTMTGGDLQMLRYLQQLAGYCLTGETREQGFYVLWGPGANGKTTFQRVVEILTGPYAVTVQASTFAKSKFHQIHNQLATMYGKRVVTTSEVEEGQEFSEVTLKTLTGQDKVAARDLYQSWFNYVPQYKLIIATNYRPRLSGYDEAVWRRVNLIPFSVVIPKEKRDANLLPKLKGELSGILNWAVAGCVDWQKNGLVVPQAVREATNAYRENMDTVEDWIKACCLRDKAAKAGISVLHQNYVTFCKAEGYDYPYGRRRFSEIMQGKGFISARGTGGYGVLLGVSLIGAKEPTAEAPLPF
jgi:putative DNA primase/helicase